MCRCCVSGFAQKRLIADGIVDDAPQWCVDDLTLHIACGQFVSMFRQKVYEGVVFGDDVAAQPSGQPLHHDAQRHVHFVSEQKVSTDSVLSKRVR